MHKALFDEMASILTERGLLLRQGTIVDATLIAAPPSTKNRTKSRDPEMKQTKKSLPRCRTGATSGISG